MVEVSLQPHQLAAGEDLVDRHLLGHVAQQTPHGPGLAQGIQATHPHQAAVGGQQGAEDAQGGGLAGAIGPKQAIEAAVWHLQGELIEGYHPLTPPSATVTLAELLQFDHRARAPQSANQCRQHGQPDVEELRTQQGCLGQSGDQQQQADAKEIEN